jgi:hypothetical protein
LERHYLFLRGQEIQPQYCVLPTPWPQAPGFGESADVEVLIHRQPADQKQQSFADPGYRLAVTVNDQLLGTVIGYLGAGDLPSAGKLLAHIEDLAEDILLHKMGNPLAAAAGAYVLLGNQHTAKQERWHHWIGNLAEGYRWLPDGAIQHAWVKLRHQKVAGNLEEARASLLEGFRRGLPFYSQGVRLLVDGLTLFANDARAADTRDKEVESALRSVRRWSRQINVRQAFTCMLAR